MPKIFPFRATHYNTESFKNLSEVITPPYDTIAIGEEKKYLNRSPYNFAHVDLPQSSQDTYTHAQSLLTKWKEKNILQTEKMPGAYLYRQTFKFENQTYKRECLMASVLLSDFSEGKILPHEKTHGEPKKDRLQLMRSTQFNLSPVFGMVRDEEGVLQSLYERWEFKEPLLYGKTDDGSEHAVWKIDPSVIKDLSPFFEKHPLYIVDGHHRYESALAFAKETGSYQDPAKNASSILFAIARSGDPGLKVLPTHRRLDNAPKKITLESLRAYFEVETWNPEDMAKWIQKPSEAPSFGLYWNQQLYRCTAMGCEKEEAKTGKALAHLPLYWSDKKLIAETMGIGDSQIYNYVSYEKDWKAFWSIRNEAESVIFHAPVAVESVMAVADDRQFMPPKSTYFYPKLASGLVLRDLTVYS